MYSPVYPDVQMKKLVKKGVEIEYCPKSGGVWLDKGELEKFIEAYNQSEYTYEDNAPLGDSKDEDDYRDHGKSYKSKDHYYRHKKKKESFLGEIFDIF